MSTINDGGPAFPVADYDHQTFVPKNIEETRRLLSGMSLRDYLAGLAMQSLISMDGAKVGDEGMQIPKHSAIVAETAYAMADEMLKAREQKGP